MNPTTRRIRVVLADDHKLVREGFRALLQDGQSVEVVGEADDGEAALEQVAATRPDVVVMDIGMPRLNGIDATHRVRELPSAPEVLILSMHASSEMVVAALRAGARGYLVKDDAGEDLEAAIRAVARGKPYISTTVSGVVVRKLIPGVPDAEPAGDDSPWDRLTERQREVLQLIAEGHSTKEIAAQLDRSVKTIDTFRSQIMERLDIHDVASLTRYAIRTKLVSADA